MAALVDSYLPPNEFLPRIIRWHNKGRIYLLTYVKKGFLFRNYLHYPGQEFWRCLSIE